MIATTCKKEKKHLKKVEDHFLKCLHQKHKIDQKDCWNTKLYYCCVGLDVTSVFHALLIK